MDFKHSITIILISLCFIFASPLNSNGSSNNAGLSKADSYAYFMRGIIEWNRWHPVDAYNSFKNALRANPNSPTILKMLARLSKGMGNTQEAIEYANKAFKLSNDSEFKLFIARVYLEEQKPEKAIQILEQLLKENPDDTNTLILLGTIYAQNRDIKKAEKLLHKAAELDKEKAFFAYYTLGDLFLNNGEYDRAEKYFKKAIELNPDFLAAYLGLALTYEQNGKIDLAIETNKKILEKEPTHSKALQNYLFLLLLSGKIEKVIEELEKYSTIKHPAPELAIHLMMGLPEERQNDDLALKFMQKLHKRYPNSDEIKFYLAQLYEERGEIDQAINLFKTIPPSSKLGPLAAARIAFILKKQGKIKEAIHYLQKAWDEDPNNKTLGLSLASFYSQLGQHQKEIQVLKSLLKKFPNDSEVLFNYVMALDKQGEQQKAIEYAKRILSIDPDNPYALNYLGYTYAEKGIKLDEAQKMIEKALEKMPQDGFILDSLGWVFYKKGLFDEAISTLKTALELSPNDPTITEHLADAYKASGKLHKAMLYYKKALKLLSETSSKQRKRIKKKLIETQKKLQDMMDY